MPDAIIFCSPVTRVGAMSLGLVQWNWDVHRLLNWISCNAIVLMQGDTCIVSIVEAPLLCEVYMTQVCCLYGSTSSSPYSPCLLDCRQSFRRCPVLITLCALQYVGCVRDYSVQNGSLMC